MLRQGSPPGNAGLQPGLEATLERGAPRKNPEERAADVCNRHLATLRFNLYLGKGRHFAEFEHLLGAGGRKHMHAPGDDAGPAGLMAGAEAGAVVAVKVLVEREVIAPVRVLLKRAGAPVDRPPALVVPQKDAASAGARSPRRPDTGSCAGRSPWDIRS